eukprot:scaffold7766_cov277-Pinguiococcus_pyrenoidosus.AAC.3
MRNPSAEGSSRSLQKPAAAVHLTGGGGVVAVLDAAHVVVPIGAVHQEDAEVDGVEVRDDVLGAAEKAPREAHEPVACVVDLPCHAPPATDEKLPAPLRRQRLEVRNLRTAGIPSKRVLLAICSAEDRVAHHLPEQMLPDLLRQKGPTQQRVDDRAEMRTLSRTIAASA